MNNKDIQLMRDIMSLIDDLDKGNKVLFSVSYDRIAKTNLILLRGLLEELKKSGILITVDRPHQYMEHLLRIHRINYDNLLFIDTIARFSGSNLNGDLDVKNVALLDSPFQIDLLPTLLSLNSNKVSSTDGRIDIDGVDFILIDNVATMLNYNDPLMVEGFLENYITKFGSINNFLISLTLDRIAHNSLYQAAKRLFDREIDIDVLRHNKIANNIERRDKVLLPHGRDSLDLFSFRRCLDGGD